MSHPMEHPPIYTLNGYNFMAVCAYSDTLHHKHERERKMPSGTPLFRRQALEYYVQSREQTILPRLVRPPVFPLLWLLLCLTILALLIAWQGQVPIYISGSGVVPARGTIVLAFLPAFPNHTLQIHAGAPVHLRIGTPAQTINSTVERVETGVLSPADIQKRYGSGDRISQIITGPSIVISIKLDAPFYEGSIVNVQVQVGTTHVLSLLSGSSLSNGE
jgi:hypothetical protein